MITVYAVGKIKESFYREAVEEYAARLQRYDRLRIVEVADEKAPENLHEADREKVLASEGERLLKKIPEKTYLIALAIDGKRMDSIAFSEKIASLRVRGESEIGFVIGGSLGLSEAVLRRADERLSFSDMTFPHQLMRVILLEQIYRAEKILAHEPYHK